MGSIDSHLSSAVLDSTILEDLNAIDPAIVVDLAHAFVSDVPHRVEALQQAVRDRLGNDVLREAHGLKGGACAIGATRLAELCAAIEQDACAGHFTDANARAELLPKVYAELTQSLERTLSRLQSSARRGAA